ncbi:hypothetical protein ElyMa_005112100 [Elysia marginata]|uniref:Uncharacterized protein n=1 Tax=Elysia marginata TaxID=1093978 RepID=A0AAV4JPP6_9GAST|nr:hypothetical protein ElyMa_005112100 [Elysia marginata]
MNSRNHLVNKLLPVELVEVVVVVIAVVVVVVVVVAVVVVVIVVIAVVVVVDIVAEMLWGNLGLHSPPPLLLTIFNHLLQRSSLSSEFIVVTVVGWDNRATETLLGLVVDALLRPTSLGFQSWLAMVGKE